jgi:hypothetical protein
MPKLALFVAALFVGLTGCSLTSAPPPKPTVISFPKVKQPEAVPKLVGIVALLNQEGGFVLVESNFSGELAPGTALKCFRDGVESAIIAVGKERRRPYVTADIVTGEPQKGDQVFE